MNKRFGLALAAVGFAGGAAVAGAAAKKEIAQQTIADLEWHDLAPGLPVKAADSWKGPGGAHCAFNKFPRGFVAPPHFHTKDLHAVVLSGNWGSWTDGTPEKLLGPGGIQVIPGGVKHVTKCAPAVDCVIYVCGPGPFDIKGLPADRAPAPHPHSPAVPPKQ
jgi:hypothetical protein